MATFLTQAQADQIIESTKFNEIWCNATICGCLGCVNKHGGIEAKGVTHSQWMDWKRRNPPSQKTVYPFYSSNLDASLKEVFQPPIVDTIICDAPSDSSSGDCGGGGGE